jgi:DNA mismatch repair ATPase MutS
MQDQVRKFHLHKVTLKGAYKYVSEREALICVQEHITTLKIQCWGTRANERSIRLVGFVNPLLPSAVPLTLDLLNQGVFISGKNGVGKSTLLRAVGINVVSKRAFGFCYAKEAAVPDLPVYSSIENSDSLAVADSLYMAELRRADTLVKIAQGETPAIFLIDEIFRGTNNSESISAAGAVLEYLARRGVVLVSSHNLILAHILKGQLQPLQVVKGPAPDGQLSLEPGILLDTNGISLMESYEFPTEILEKARRIFSDLSLSPVGN